MNELIEAIKAVESLENTLKGSSISSSAVVSKMFVFSTFNNKYPLIAFNLTEMTFQTV